MTIKIDNLEMPVLDCLIASLGKISEMEAFILLHTVSCMWSEDKTVTDKKSLMHLWDVLKDLTDTRLFMGHKIVKHLVEKSNGKENQNNANV